MTPAETDEFERVRVGPAPHLHGESGSVARMRKTDPLRRRPHRRRMAGATITYSVVVARKA